jgi:aromatic ring-opening dioxygenase catalytic subunit (LigB family)
MNNRATVLFIPHGGGPLPLLGEPSHAGMNRFLQDWPATIAKPDGIIVISAHWEEPVVSITAAPALLFDYYGFPAETYEYQYPAPGNPALATRVQDLLRQAGIEANLDARRGFDHGLFVPLMLMYPEADIPCIQISLAASLDAGEHVRIGQALAGLKSDNLLILGSGFSFHNMQALMSKRDDSIDPRNQEFETWLMQTTPASRRRSGRNG